MMHDFQEFGNVFFADVFVHGVAEGSVLSVSLSVLARA